MGIKVAESSSLYTHLGRQDAMSVDVLMGANYSHNEVSKSPHLVLPAYCNGVYSAVGQAWSPPGAIRVPHQGSSTHIAEHSLDRRIVLSPSHFTFRPQPLSPVSPVARILIPASPFVTDYTHSRNRLGMGIRRWTNSTRFADRGQVSRPRPSNASSRELSVLKGQVIRSRQDAVLDIPQSGLGPFRSIPRCDLAGVEC